MSPDATIRSARPSDRAAIEHICIATGLDGEDASAHYATPQLLAEVWALPYLAHDPSLCLLAERAGDVMGYVIGAADTLAFEEWAELAWWPPLRERYPLAGADPRDRPLIERIHHRGAEARPWLRDFPAHLHIDLLPATQGMGLGRRLIDAFASAVRERGIAGIHLGVSHTNPRALGFYRHLGFVDLASGSDHVTLGLRL